MSVCGVMSVVGSVIGWTGSFTLVALDTPLPDERQVLLTMVLLSIGLFCSASLVFRRRQAPLGMVFELGYNAGRRDAIREATRGASVSPIRRVPNGLGAFNRDKVGS